MEINDKKISPLKQFNLSFLEKHFFEELDSSFWDTENIITKKFKSLKDSLPKESQSSPSSPLNIAYNIILNTKQKELYCNFLLYQYTLSQPRNICQLVDEYYSIIFPFYLFVLKNLATNIDEGNFIILDNMNFQIKYYEKNILKQSFEVDTINQISIKENSVVIKIFDNKTDLILTPIMEDQTEFLHALIIFMGMIKLKKENWKKELKKVNEINQNIKKDKRPKSIFDENINKIQTKLNIDKLFILSNDSFIPKGIKLSSYINIDKNKFFLILGSTYIIIFKDEEMKEIIYIIPINPGSTMFEFEENEKNIKIKISNKIFNIYLTDSEIFAKFKLIVGNISEVSEEWLDEEDVVKVSKALYCDKIMGGDFQKTPIYTKIQKDINYLEYKIDMLKRAKAKTEEENIFYQKVNEFYKNK